MPTKPIRSTLAFGLLTVMVLLAPPAEAAVWRVLEALGETRARVAEDARWRPLLAGGALAGAHQVVTGPSGHAILAAGPLTVSVEPGSRLVLPRDGIEVLQEHGRARYRASGAARVLTPHAVILLEDAVVELGVAGEATEVHVVLGTARLQGSDGVTLAAGARRTLHAPGVVQPAAPERAPAPAPVAAPIPRRSVPASAPASAPPSAPAGAPIPLFPNLP
jgi:hypothetical protein